MFTIVGYETSASEAALTAITPIPDPTVAVIGNDIRVPKGMNNVVAASAMINSASATLRAQIQSPLLRAVLNYDISPIVNGLVYGAFPSLVRLWDTPLLLAELEPLDVYVQNGANVMNRAFITLADGPVKPVTGKVYTVRCTAAATLATATWVNSTLTFQQTLPAGHYQCVGMRTWSANGVYARIYFVGYAWRPGAPMLNAEANNEWADFRLGKIGVWGEFDNTTPPTVDFMGITDTAQVVYLDLIKTA